MQTPNLSLKSDPACIAFRSFSSSRLLGFVQRLDAGGAGELHSLGGRASESQITSLDCSSNGIGCNSLFLQPRSQN